MHELNITNQTEHKHTQLIIYKLNVFIDKLKEES